jgi:hypothetical protein
MLMVVSDDRQVQQSARMEGARIKSVDDFLDAGRDSSRLSDHRIRNRHLTKAELTPGQVREINAEFTKLWLK